MSVHQVAGAKFFLGSVPGTAKAITAISNATNAVATLEPSHGVAVNDWVYIASGWALLDGRVARASAVATNDVTLEGIDTSDTTLFVPGSGTGTVKEFTWATELSQITPDFTTSGGEQNYADATFVSHLLRQRIPTDREPVSVQLPYFFDLSLAWVATVRTAARASSPRPFMMQTYSGMKIASAAYWSISQMPTVNDKTLRGQIDLALTAESTQYVV